MEAEVAAADAAAAAAAAATAGCAMMPDGAIMAGMPGIGRLTGAAMPSPAPLAAAMLVNMSGTWQGTTHPHSVTHTDSMLHTCRRHTVRCRHNVMFHALHTHAGIYACVCHNLRQRQRVEPWSAWCAAAGCIQSACMCPPVINLQHVPVLGPGLQSAAVQG
jgi:hypothetical protein